jgi:hypothetical protein
VTRSLSQLAGFGGAAGLALAARDVKNFEEKLLRLRIQAGQTADESERLKKKIRGISDVTGIAAADLLAGTAQFVSLTGRMDQANDSLRVFAKVAAASGAEMADIAQTAAAMTQNMEIDPKNLEQAFSVLLFQGKKGAIELKELSTLMATLASQFPEFGSKGVRGLSELGASMQVARQGFGSASEAATGFMGMMTAFVKKSSQFKRKGIDIFAKIRDPKSGKMKEQARNILDIIADVKKAGLTYKEVIDIMGRAEGARSLQMLMKNLEIVGELADEGEKATDVQKDYMTWQQSSAARMNRSWQRMKNTIARLFTPARIERFAAAMEKLAEIIGFLADNLKVTLTLLAAAKVSPALLAFAKAGGGGFIGGYTGSGGKGGAKSKGGKAAKGSRAGGALKAAGQATIVGGVAYYAGGAADEYFGISDWISGVEDTTVRPSQYDPTGAAASREVRARQLKKSAFLARGFQKLGGVNYSQMRAGVEESQAQKLLAEAAKIREWERATRKADEGDLGATAGGAGVHPALAAPAQRIEVTGIIKVDERGLLQKEVRVSRQGEE